MRDQPHTRPPKCTGGGNLPAAIRRYNVGRVSEVKWSTSRNRKYAGIVSVPRSAFPLPRKAISADASRSARLLICDCNLIAWLMTRMLTKRCREHIGRNQGINSRKATPEYVLGAMRSGGALRCSVAVAFSTLADGGL